ncbi:MAG TPA: hypothetical protein VMT82_00185 [candidate division Zixibacteria bacterium]|nr:hypothetical protein [candidate division Zixibacteria bacterium]
MKRKVTFIYVVVLLFAAAASAQVKQVRAGEATTVDLGGSGSATVYLFGPATAAKRKVQLPKVELSADDLSAAGVYTLIANGKATKLVVTAGPVSELAFLARPSRVPTAANGAINGSAFLFDKNQNLVRTPETVQFQLQEPSGKEETRTSTSKNGVAWARMNSGKKSGAAQFVARAGESSVRRVVQQVAADPCNIHMHAALAQPDARDVSNSTRLVVETDPIRDCSGNAVPDGTIVTFTSVGKHGRSTVDARIKQGIARAELPSEPGERLSVAAGVVVGNEIVWGGGQ